MSRGATVLPAAMVAVAVGAALGAVMVEVGRIEVALAGRRRATAEALHAVDGCVAQTIASVSPAWDLSALLDGPDGVAGTSDDGRIALPAGCTGRAGPPGAAVPPRALVTVEARTSRARRGVEALVGLAAAPGVPALLWLTTSSGSETIAGAVSLDGADAAIPPSHWAAFAAPDEPEELDAWLALELGHVTVAANTAPPFAATPPPLAALGARVRAAGPAGAAVLVPSAPAVALAYVAGDLTIVDRRQGAGLLFVDGTLDIQAVFDFTGLVVASGGIRIASGASCTVNGVLWLGVPTPFAPSLLVDGNLALRRDPAALAAADGLVPLPRPAVLLGLRDLG